VERIDLKLAGGERGREAGRRRARRLGNPDELALWNPDYWVSDLRELPRY
jgi:hypothetical protein